MFTPTRLLATLILLAVLSACSAPSGPAAEDSAKLNVLATTTILGDVIRQIGGENIDLHVLLPAGADPHGYDPSPQDLTRAAEADLIFVTGTGIEGFLERMVENAASPERVISVSEGLAFRHLEEGDEHAAEDEHASADDPHVWFNPLNLLTWVDNIEQALSAKDPANQATYARNAAAYRQELQDLDGWIAAQVEQVPLERRVLVSDHLVFGYFAERYGFQQAGSVIPGFSSAAQPSAQELAALQQQVRDLNAPAIFVGSTVNPALTRSLAEDAGLQLVTVYTDSLTEPGGEAGSYLAFMRYNVSQIVSALAGK